MKQLLLLSLLLVLGTSWVWNRGAKNAGSDPVDPKVEKLKLLPGFKAEHLYSPTGHKQGSWVSMTFDDRGRLITSDQFGALYRLELPPIGSSVSPKVEQLTIPPGAKAGATSSGSKLGMGYAQGLLWAFNSLYVMVNHQSDSTLARGSGLYRLQDTDGDDQFDKITLLKALTGEGEHGPHSVVLAPDKKSIYVMAGNFTDVPKMDAYRLPPVWKEDNLFPALKDPRGHATDRTAPGGWLAKVDSTGQQWEFIAGGFRNAFDLAINDAGDLFTYDSDMEWDFGLPWYKPTRICHITSGAEFGWRTGSSNWSPTFADNLPAVLNMGQGSPSGVFFGTNARFPQKYRQALFAFDWSFGILYAVHLQPTGASYSAKAEEFISGSPLPLTDGQIGPDGAMYFLTGGRRLESDLYRVYYAGTENPASAPQTRETAEHQLRTKLEAFHGQPNPTALNVAWPHLNHPDRFVRYAARIAVEHQPVDQWQARVLAETDPGRAIQGAIALARMGKPALETPLVKALLNLNFGSFTETQQADLLRAFELVFSRMGMPEPMLKTKVIAYLTPHYPAKTALLNRSFSKLLIYLEAPGAVAKTVALLDQKETAANTVAKEEMAMNSADLILRNPMYGLDIANMLSKIPPAQQTYYAVALSSASQGWTPELRSRYFRWFAQAFSFKGGKSYAGFMDKARKLALNHVPKEQVARYNALSGDAAINTTGNGPATGYIPKGPYRSWKIDYAVAVVDSAGTNRNFERGRQIYSAVICDRCHTMRGEGGDIGPDLTQLGTRFSTRDILEAITMPSKAISDQYAASIYTLKNGQSVVGRLVGEDKDSYSIAQNPFATDVLRKIPKKDVVSTRYSPVSIMIPGLINTLNESELRDLMAYLKSGGNEKSPIYTSPSSGK
ncbi:hypothetical protein GCM10028803_42410 [Larkinella knui]|uniref:Heme-binding protein n=1 Tax=Larkinella knui TaxID=2025310 RepID=A0A3P1CNU1_9BACT|nr:c-type cytochrome [Larkinella knui]RRB14870.1 heme-binding protein [Larkinella knui]